MTRLLRCDIGLLPARPDRDGVRLGADAYGYSRAFSYFPNADERRWTSEVSSIDTALVLGGVLTIATVLGINKINPKLKKLDLNKL